jgi:branched-chain amino acid transport system substrate-binding protein
VLGLASFGADAQNLIKQANEFNLNMRIAAPLLTLADVYSLGPGVAHGLLYTSAFYWDRDQAGRAFAARFAKRFNGKMPTEGQAATYSAVSHYLKAIVAAGSYDKLQSVLPRWATASHRLVTTSDVPLFQGYQQ